MNYLLSIALIVLCGVPACCCKKQCTTKEPVKTEQTAQADTVTRSVDADKVAATKF